MSLRRSLAVITSLALVAAIAGAASAGPTTIRATRCTLAGDDLDASIRYTENATGRTLDYQLAITDGLAATTTLRDSGGRVVAAASATASGATSVRFGTGWSSQTYLNLVGVVGDAAVQSQLRTCAAPAPTVPGFHPWNPYCPILVFVWDPDLVQQLCGWLPPDPHLP